MPRVRDFCHATILPWECQRIHGQVRRRCYTPRPMAVDPPTCLVGEVVDERWKLIDQLGAGGMGVVYRAERVKLGKPVALKFLRRAGAGAPRRRWRASSARRARSAGCSTGTASSILDFGVCAAAALHRHGVRARPSAQRADDRQADMTPTARGARSCGRSCAALRHAHATGVVHRDLKPENVMLAETDRRPRTSSSCSTSGWRASAARRADASRSPKHGGGTPSYMSPEQARGEKIDHRTDIYSAGVMLYGCATGKRPFVADDTIASCACT